MMIFNYSLTVNRILRVAVSCVCVHFASEELSVCAVKESIIFHLREIVEELTALKGSFVDDWGSFVMIIKIFI